MKVSSKHYAEKLLFETEPIEAVWGMFEEWRSRPGFSENLPFFGLSEPEFNAYVFITYAGDVGNGGHRQYFMNFGEQSSAVLRALDTLKFERAADIFRRALSVFPSGEVPADPFRRTKVMETFAQNVYEFWGKLDKEFFQVNMSYWELLLLYLRDNEFQVFQTERNG